MPNLSSQLCWQLPEPERFRTYPLRELGQVKNSKQSLKRLPKQRKRTRRLASTKTCGSLLPFSLGFGRGCCLRRSQAQPSNDPSIRSRVLRRVGGAALDLRVRRGNAVNK